MDQAGTSTIEEDIEDVQLEEHEDLEDDQQDDQAEGSDEGTEDDENEIILEGDDGSHPQQDEQRGIRKRINKLNAKVAKAESGAQETLSELEVERERNRLLQLALESQNGQNPDAPPDPNDFDDGVTDPGFIAAYQDHIANGVQSKIAQQGDQKAKAEIENRELKERQIAHYKKADTLKMKDYDDTEDQAIAILGQDVVNQMISASDKSPELLYYLGKNKSFAEDLASLIKTNPVKGVMNIGALEARLKARPKANVRNAPDPDTELSGGGSGQPRQQRGPKGATFE